MLKTISCELKRHVPFTLFGTVTGIVILLVFVYASVPPTVSQRLFQIFHPLHVLLSALATAGMYRLHGKKKLWATILIGYLGSIGIATLSDSVIPYLGELLLDLPHAHVHAGFIEDWWLVNPLALIGATIAYFRPTTRFPHAGHVLLSTWASLFHMIMAFGGAHVLGLMEYVLVPVFLFLAVWVPCCTSDIVFPLLLAGNRE